MILKLIIVYTQAWAFATAVRKMVGKAPNMSMNNFPKDVWILHRKLVHRYLRFKRCFDDCLNDVPEYRKALKENDGEASSAAEPAEPSKQIICLLVVRGLVVRRRFCHSFRGGTLIPVETNYDCLLHFDPYVLTNIRC